MVEAFRKVAVKAKDVEAKKQKERQAEEKRRQEVLRKKREQEQQSLADVTELTDEEAERMQKEIDARKYKPMLLLKRIKCNHSKNIRLGKVSRAHLPHRHPLNRSLALMWRTMKRKIRKRKVNSNQTLEMGATWNSIHGHRHCQKLR